MMGMRLQKYMASCGVASRRACEKIIAEGRVCVNGQIVTQMGKIVSENDCVTVDGQRIALLQDRMYLLYNKPKGVVCTAGDVHADRTVFDEIQPDRRLFTVGRLDKDTEGLIVLTDDGDLTFALTHPSHVVEKTYECLVKGHPNAASLRCLSEGVTIDLETGPYVTQPARVRLMKETLGASVLRLTITEGKNRQVRRMCEAVGHPVIALKRVAIGSLTDVHLPVGKWRALRPEEIENLRIQR